MSALLLTLLLQSGAPQPALDVLGDINAARLRLCPGDDRRVPLQTNDRLNTATARVAGGATPEEAMATAGYPARRTASIELQGYGDDAELQESLAFTYCALIADPDFHDVGISVNHDHVWVVMAVERHAPLDAAAVRARVVKLTNEARSQSRRCGDESFRAASPLRLNPQLERAALRHSQDMAKYSFMAHEGRDRSTPAERVTRAGYQWVSVGENVAAGPETADEVVGAWLASPHHCANIMNPMFGEMGVAYAANSRDGYGVYWTMNFGTPR